MTGKTDFRKGQLRLRNALKNYPVSKPLYNISPSGVIVFTAFILDAQVLAMPKSICASRNLKFAGFCHRSAGLACDLLATPTFSEF